jgi:aspartyl aminopeptidase
MDNSLTSLFGFLDGSPTPFHVVESSVELLQRNGFVRQSAFSGQLENKGFFVRDGAIIAWSLGATKAPLRIIGAHTDSPNLRVQPNPNIQNAGWSQLGIEIYGGVLLNSWLDRDLGLAGRVLFSDGTSSLFTDHSALARVPQLAIHLDRDVNERGVQLDKHQHTVPVWGTSAPSFHEWLSQKVGRADIAFYDAHLFDISPATVLGVDKSLIASARLDNQLSCWSALQAITSADSEYNVVVVLNDHEEVGSESMTGAAGPMLESVVDAILNHHGVTRMERHDLLASSWCLSADNAHAVHPNYQERHDPRHGPRVNEGAALKLNGNQRYATTARGAAHIRNIADAVDAPLQVFVSRNNMPCGSTIGPITSTRLGIEAIDIGAPQLSMHSARELSGSKDPAHLVSLMSGFIAR